MVHQLKCEFYLTNLTLQQVWATYLMLYTILYSVVYNIVLYTTVFVETQKEVPQRALLNQDKTRHLGNHGLNYVENKTTEII